MARTASAAGTGFADVVYADQELVDAEFAEIVAASLGGPTAPPPPAPPTVPPRRGRPDLGFPPSARAADTLVFPGTWPPRSRQRSPPAQAD